MFNARANNAGWRIDYFLVSDRIADKITATPIYSTSKALTTARWDWKSSYNVKNGRNERKFLPFFIPKSQFPPAPLSEPDSFFSDALCRQRVPPGKWG